MGRLMATMGAMMRRAGIDVDQDKATMMAENLTLRKAADDTKTSNKALTQQNETLTQQMENAANSLTCRICQEKPVDRVMPGCGHLLCSRCLPNVRGSKCPFCRKPFAQTVPFINPLQRFITNLEQ